MENMENKTPEEFLDEVHKNGYFFDNDLQEFLYSGSTVVEKMKEYAEYQIKRHLEKAEKRVKIIVKDVDGNLDEGSEFNLAFAGDSSRANVTISKHSITETPIEL